jgi:hypothetical protein
MKNIILSTILLLTSNVFAQKFIGIPFLDKCIKMSPCDLCDTKNPKTIAYMDSIEVQLDKIITEEKSNWQAPTMKLIDQEIQRYSLSNTSAEAGLSHQKEILGRLKLLKVKLLIEHVISVNDIVYNLALSENETLKDFSGVTEINNLLEDVISLNISESTNRYCRELRMKYMNESYALEEIYLEDFSWYEMNDLKKLKGISEDRVNAAKIFLADEKTTEFVPFSSFNGIGIGAVGAYGKGTWAGYEITDEYVSYSNPFMLNHRISGGSHIRGSLFGTSYLWNMNDRSKQDLTIHILNFKHPYLNINLIQFGAHYGLADKGKWFYRPEIGFSYGIFKLGYSYNLTFDKSFRSQTEKSMLTFGISYPLFRLGDYY